MTRVSLAIVVALVGVPATWAGGAGSEATAAPAAQTCGPAPAGRVAVAVVVDDGVRSPSVRCVEVPERSTGYDVLRAAGHSLRIDAGFLCAIDGEPATGCANGPDFDGRYWRYFHASPGGPWTYSNVGGGGYRVPPRCAIEGWRFSGAAGTNVTPRVPPPAMQCEAPPTTAAPRPSQAPPPAPVPTAAPSRPPVPAPTPNGGGSAVGRAPASQPPPGAVGSDPSIPGPDAADPTVDAAAGLGAGGGDDLDSVGGDGADADTGPDVETGGDDAAAIGDSDDVEVAGATQSADDEARDEQAAAVVEPRPGGSGSPLGVLAAVGLLLALAGARAVQVRRRATGSESGDLAGNA